MTSQWHPAAVLLVIVLVTGSAFGQSVGSSAQALEKQETRRSLACGPCAMSFVVEILGVSAQNEELAAICDPSGNSTFADLARFARRKSLYAEALRMTPAQLSRLERVAILQVVVRVGTTDEWQEHFVTWAGPGHTPSTGVVFDPITSGGRGEVPMSAIASKWTGAALVISDEPINVAEIVGTNGGWPALARTAALGAAAGVVAVAALAWGRSRRGHRAVA